MIAAFKTAFNRIANKIEAEFTSKDTEELQLFVNNHNFEKPLINAAPLGDFLQKIEVGGQTSYEAEFEIHFLTKAVKSNSSEDTKDDLIDDMIYLSTLFFTDLHKSELFVFRNTNWHHRDEILRQFTSNFLVGIKTKVKLVTESNRIWERYSQKTK